MSGVNCDDDLKDNILEAVRGSEHEKANLTADFKPTVYAGILFLGTCLKIYKKYTVEIEGYTCCNLYRLANVAEYLGLDYDRGKQATKIYKDLEKDAEVKIFTKDNKTYVGLTDNGIKELRNKVGEVLKLKHRPLAHEPSPNILDNVDIEKIKDVQKPAPEDKRQYQKLFKNPRILLPSVAASVIIIAVIAFFALQPAPQHPLRIIVHAIDPYQGSRLAQVELSTVNGISRNQTFNLTGSNQSVPIVVPRGLIHDGEPFKVCISLVYNHSRNCVIGLNHPTNQPEVVPLKVPG